MKDKRPRFVTDENGRVRDMSQQYKMEDASARHWQQMQKEKQLAREFKTRKYEYDLHLHNEMSKQAVEKSYSGENTGKFGILLLFLGYLSWEASYNYGIVNSTLFLILAILLALVGGFLFLEVVFSVIFKNPK